MTHSRPLAAGLLALALGAGAARAEPGLDRLIPLTEVYDARKASPAFDVAGIRCAALFTAQLEWARKAGIKGPSRAQIADVERNLTRAEITRRDQGQSTSRAYQTTLRDVQRVIALYTERFRRNAGGGGAPWAADGLIRSDTAYCNLLNGRR